MTVNNSIDEYTIPFNKKIKAESTSTTTDNAAKLGLMIDVSCNFHILMLENVYCFKLIATLLFLTT